jgi:Response regulators consisting of a CheY-like receiver domain and a winged-helix DNA-binding domain
MATSAAMAPSAPEGSSRFESLRLTKKERELLSVLMQNQGRCISRELLLKTVWKYCEGAKTRTVDVHIQRLRQKLGSQGAACLKTIVRAGYCWLPDPEAAVEHS